MRTNPVNMTVKLQGGAPKMSKVKQTLLKQNKTYTIKTTDLGVFQKAHDVCKKIADAPHISFKALLANMTVAEMMKLKDFILHDKTNLEKKFKNIFSYTQEGIALENVSCVITECFERGVELCRDGIIIDVGKQGGTEIPVNAKSITAFIDMAIAYKTGQEESTMI